MKILKPFLSASVIALVCSFGLIANAQTTTTIINDNFTDGDRAATGALEADFFASSGSNAIESNANSVGLVSGSSGRQIHAIFPTQTLANVGDNLFASITFLTPATVATTNEELRVGLFDHLGRGDAGGPLFQDTSYDTQNPNADYNGLFGYYTELDVEANDSATDFDIRRSDPSTSGRLLATTGGFTSLPGSSGPDLGYAIVADTSYTYDIEIERNAANGLDISLEFLGNTITLTDDTPGSFNFGLLALGAGTTAFGSSNNVGEADNGIEITNFTVEFTTLTAVPEPSSALLLLSGLFSLGLMRRRS